MISTFLGVALAIITVFGLILPTWHWLSMGWKESEQKGTNPYIGGLFGLFVGYMIGFAIVGSFMILVGLLGFEGQVINCYHFTGGDEELCQEAYAEAWGRAEESGTLPEQLDEWQGEDSSQKKGNSKLPKLPKFPQLPFEGGER